MAEYQSPNSSFGARTDVILMEAMTEVLFCLLKGFSLDVVEKPIDCEVDCLLPVEESLELFDDRASSLSSTLDMA